MHTPGPWKFTTPGQEIFAPNGKSADGTLGVTVGEVHGDFAYPQDLANARLIAAAPDLLTALKWLVHEGSYPDPSNLFPDALDKARIAIAKAEGRS